MITTTSWCFKAVLKKQIQISKKYYPGHRALQAYQNCGLVRMQLYDVNPEIGSSLWKYQMR